MTPEHVLLHLHATFIEFLFRVYSLSIYQSHMAGYESQFKFQLHQNVFPRPHSHMVAGTQKVFLEWIQFTVISPRSWSPSKFNSSLSSGYIAVILESLLLQSCYVLLEKWILFGIYLKEHDWSLKCLTVHIILWALYLTN